MTTKSEVVVIHDAKLTPLSELRPHPRNYRPHPEDQVEHLVRSIQEQGFYRNVVTARDGTVLAGHGVLIAAERLGLDQVPVVRLDLDPGDPQAIKLLVADNEIAHLAEIDDRLLSGLLLEVREIDSLAGTGYDDAMLANLLFVTRPESEIRDLGAANEWIGLPDFEPGDDEGPRLVLHFDDDAGRAELIEKLGLTISKKNRQTWAAWYPARPKDDSRSLRFEVDG